MLAAVSSPASSARNLLRGHVSLRGHASRIVPQGSLVQVSIDASIPLVASISGPSATEMGLEAGSAIVATFKALAVHPVPTAS